MPIGVVGVGAYVPDDVIDNELIATWADTTQQWIEQRVGIVERRYAPDHMFTSGLAHAAVMDLVASNPDALTGLSAIILATSTPDQPQPATAAILQRRLEITGVPAFDLNAVCSGFIYAVAVGAALAEQDRTGRRVLVTAADKYSGIMDSTDRRTVALFGDGAGAVLLGQVPDGYGLRAVKLVTQGEHSDWVEVPGGGTRQPLDVRALEAGRQFFRMQGRQVREYVMSTLPQLVQDALNESGLERSEIARWVLHQANPRLIGEFTRHMAIDPNRVPITATMYGNTGAASIPITLRDSIEEHRLRRGDHVVFASVGGGMNAAVAVMTWH